MRIALILSVVVLIAGCVKDSQNIPPEFSSNPVFGFAADINGQQVDFQAGIDDYILTTNWDQNSDDIAFSYARFEKKNCPDCGPNIEFRVYSEQQGQGSVDGLSNVISPGALQFATPALTPDSIEVSFTVANNIDPNPLHYWELASSPNPISDLTLQQRLDYDDEVSICLNTLTNSNCYSTKCISFVPSESPGGCDAQVIPGLINDQFVLLEAVGMGEPPFQYQWKMGTETVAQTGSKVIVPLPGSGRMFITLTVEDATGCVTQVQQMMEIVPQQVLACPVDLVMNFNFIPGQIQLPLSQVELIYTDQSGAIFESGRFEQPDESMFSFLSVSDYEKTPDGINSRLAEIEFDCLLFPDGADGEEVRLVSQSTSIGLVIPQ